MGLFSSGGKGNSRANTTSTAYNSQTTTNNVDNRVFTSDMGAIAAAFEHGTAALEIGADSLETAANFAGRAGEQVGDIASESLANSRDVARDSLEFSASAIDRFANFGDVALQANSDVASDALNRVTEASRGVFDFASGGLESAFDFARDLFGDATSAQEKLAASNLSGLTGLATQNSASSDDRVQKVAMYALLAVAAVMILPRIFGKGS